MCNIRRFTDFESCSRPISTIPGSMEAGEYGLTCGTCFVARCLEVVAIAGLLWISWCVLGAAGFISFFFFSVFFFFLRSHTACCKYEAALPHFASLLVTDGLCPECFSVLIIDHSSRTRCF